MISACLLGQSNHLRERKAVAKQTVGRGRATSAADMI
jgi:hypothetical protein